MTEFTGFSDDAFEFYEGLRADNSKTYWTAHKHIYEAEVRAPMQALLDTLAPRFGATTKLFRPYRDVRFSADKSPYKTGQGGVLTVASGIGYWLQINADGVYIGGGFFARDRDQTNRFRTSVDDDTLGRQLESVLAKLTKAGYEIGGAQVKSRPRGVAADHPRLELMRREHVTVSRSVEAADALTVETVASHWKRVTPLVEWSLAYAPPTA